MNNKLSKFFKGLGWICTGLGTGLVGYGIYELAKQNKQVIKEYNDLVDWINDHDFYKKLKPNNTIYRYDPIKDKNEINWNITDESKKKEIISNIPNKSANMPIIDFVKGEIG